jgi:outer membrane protein assembly factor BamB
MGRKTLSLFLKSMAAAVCWSAALHAAGSEENWTSYRGPTDQGYCAAGDLPVRWSERENVVWKTPLPGKAWSSPVIWGDRIWLTTAPEDGTQLSAICVAKSSGKILQQKLLRVVAAPQYCHPFNSYASPSPVIEEGRVYVSFGAPYTACLNSSTGEVIWKRTDFVCNHFRGAGSSPLIYKNLLILHFDGSDHQFVVAMDKQTGKTVWKTDRSVDFHDLEAGTGQPNRDGDFRKAFSTPVIADVQGKPLLVSLGSMALYGYDPLTGAERWRVEAIGSHSGACRPVLGHGLVFSPMGSGLELWAVRPDGHGVVTDTHVVWKYKRGVSRRPSLLLVDDLLFMVDDAGVATCVAAKTGKEVWKERLGGKFSASPIYCGGKVFFFDQDGKATIIKASREYQVVAANRLEDGFMASPAVSGSALFLRTKSALYRIEDRSRQGLGAPSVPAPARLRPSSTGATPQ